MRANFKNDAGYHIEVCDNFGVHKMKPEEFAEYDEHQQVDCGEQNIYFEIYCVYMYDRDNNLQMCFQWIGAQQYFKHREVEE